MDRPRLSRTVWTLGALALLALGGAAAAVALYERGLLRVNYPSRGSYPVRGVDVSHHQGAVDWPAVRAAGIHFAFIKASEGADHRDREFERNWSGARSAGVARGAYHFFTFCTPGLAQADNFLSVAPLDAPVLPLSVDVEFTGNCVGWDSVDTIRRELVAFVGHVRSRVGHAPLLYTTEEVRAELVPAELHPERYWLRSLWGEPSSAEWQFWQYSDTGTVPGISTVVDLNVFVGQRAAWAALTSGPAAH